MHDVRITKKAKTKTGEALRSPFAPLCGLFLALALPRFSPAAEPAPADGSSTRDGPLGLFDARSMYGVGVFPEPFLVDDSDGEEGELRLDWFHAQGKGAVSDSGTAEVEKGNGLLTLEIEVPYESDESSAFDPATGGATRTRVQGFDNVDLGARTPFFQFVSNSGWLDTTFGTGIEIGVPTNSPVSKNAELVPKIFNDTRLGEHVTIQNIFGYSMLYGSGDLGGLHTFEYGFDFGYTIDRHQLPLPGVDTLIPVFELSGSTGVNHELSGHDILLGNAALRVNLRAIGPFQPRLGAGYVFPIDQGAREELRWGMYTSLVFEF
jgi:hypothetical protein